MTSFHRISAVASLSFAIAGFAPAAIGADVPAWLAQVPDSGAPRPTPATPAAPAPANPPAAEKPESHGIGWYIGTGIGAGSGAKYKLNGKSITFSDSMQGTTDTTPLIALNIINVGITFTPSLMLGFTGSSVAQSGKDNITGNDVRRQINNYFAVLTWFPVEKGFFVRGGGGLSNIQIENATGNGTDQTNGRGALLGAGYALQLGAHHNITFTYDYTRQSYSGSTTKPDSSEFGAVYVGYMYRR